MIGGGIDLIAPASLTRLIYNKQKRARSLTDLKIFGSRSHFTCAELGWEEVADFALGWAETHQRGVRVAALESQVA